MKYQRRLKTISKINTPQVNIFELGGDVFGANAGGNGNAISIGNGSYTDAMSKEWYGDTSIKNPDTYKGYSGSAGSGGKPTTQNGSEKSSSNQGLAAGLMSAAGSLNQLIGNTISQASINDPEEMKNNYRNQLGGLDTSSFDALNASKKANIAEVTASDFHNMTKGSGVLNGISAGDVGATAGNAIVPGWGALVGGVLGTGTSIVGTIIGRKRARKAVKPMNDFIKEVNKLNNRNFVNQNNNLLADQVSNLEANYAAKGGFLNMGNNIYESGGDMMYYAPLRRYQGWLNYPSIYPKTQNKFTPEITPIPKKVWKKIVGKDKQDSMSEYLTRDRRFSDAIQQAADFYQVRPELIATRLANENIGNIITYYNKDGKLLSDYMQPDAEASAFTNPYNWGYVEQYFDGYKKNLYSYNDPKINPETYLSTGNFIDPYELTSLYAASLRNGRDRMHKKFPELNDYDLDRASQVWFNQGEQNAIKSINNGLLEDPSQYAIKIKMPNWEQIEAQQAAQNSENIQTYSDGGKKSKPDFVKRLEDPNRQFLYDWIVNSEGDSIGHPMTHKLGYVTTGNDAIVFPHVATTDNGLYEFQNSKDAFNHAIDNQDTLRMSPSEAEYFTTHYKNDYPGFNAYRDTIIPAIHSYGGQFGKHSNDFSNGLVSVNNGGTHEMNPNQGVQMGVDPQGTPNLVEEGETVFGDFVFSNRITVPKEVLSSFGIKSKKKMTYADVSKYLAKESEERPNDQISQKGLERNLGLLSDAQEKQKMQKDAEERRLQALNAVNPNMPADLEMAMQGEEQMQEEQMAQEQMAQEQALQEQAAQEQMMQEQMSQQGGQPMMAAKGGFLKNCYADGTNAKNTVDEKDIYYSYPRYGSNDSFNPEMYDYGVVTPTTSDSFFYRPFPNGYTAPYSDTPDLIEDYGYTQPSLKAVSEKVQGGIDWPSTIIKNGLNMVPLVGTALDVKDLIDDPSLYNVGALGVSALGDLCTFAAPFTGGFSIPVGRGIKAAYNVRRFINNLRGVPTPIPIRHKFNQTVKFNPKYIPFPDIMEKDSTGYVPQPYSDEMPRDAVRQYTVHPNEYTDVNIKAGGGDVAKVEKNHKFVSKRAQKSPDFPLQPQPALEEPIPIDVMDFEDDLYEYLYSLGFIPDYNDVFEAFYGSRDVDSDTIDIPKITKENEKQLKDSYNIIKRQLTEDPSFRSRMDSGYKPDEIKLPQISLYSNLEDTPEAKFGKKVLQIKDNKDWVSEDLAELRAKYARPGWITPEYNPDFHMIEYYNKAKNQTEYYFTPYPESYKDNPNDYFNDEQNVIIDPVNGIVSNFGYAKQLMDDYQGSMEAGNTKYHYKADESLLQDPNFIQALRLAGVDANSIEELEKDPTYKHLTAVIKANPEKWAPFLWSVKLHSGATDDSLDFFNADGSINYGKFERNFDQQFSRVRFDGIGGIAHWVLGMLKPAKVIKGKPTGEPLTPVTEEAKTEDKSKGSKLDERRGEFLRYAGVLGDAGALAIAMMSKPNYDNVDDYFNSLKGAYMPIDYNPIGGYLPYKPIDVNKVINDYNASTNGTRRALMDVHAGNRGSLSGALTMLNNSHLNNIGNAYIAANNANWEMLKDKEKFNRETAQTNAENFLKAAMSNQSALASLQNNMYNAYKWKDDIYQRNKMAKVQAYNNLFNDLTEIGTDVMNVNDNIRITNAGGYGNGAQQMLAGYKDYKKDQNADGTWADNTYMNTNQSLSNKKKSNNKNK